MRLVAATGPLSAARTRAVLRGADGAVVVLDAQPSASGENRACIAIVREALSACAPELPVVAQINKTDLAGALDPATVAEDVDGRWPYVGAAAATGAGVVETLERVVRDVLVRMNGAAVESDGTASPVVPQAASGPRAEGNPLLAALRQVLRETVSEQVGHLEASLLAKMDERFVDMAAARRASPRGDDVAALGRAVAELRALHAKLAELTQELNRRSGRTRF